MLVPARICGETAVRNELHRGHHLKERGFLFGEERETKRSLGTCLGPFLSRSVPGG